MEQPPVLVRVKSIGLGEKIYEILGADTFEEAAAVARRKWHEQFPLGFKASIWSVTPATEKDLRRMVEVPNEQGDSSEPV